MSEAKYRIWTTGSVDAALDRMDRSERDAFDAVCREILSNPHPRLHSDDIWRSLRFRHWFYSYYDGRLPYIIRYDIEDYSRDDGAIVIFALDDASLPGDPVTLP